MKIEFEENNTNRECFTPTKKESEQITYKGKVYTYVGKSKENPSSFTRMKAAIECFFMGAAGCTGVPYIFKGFRKSFKNAINELTSGQETVKHYVLNPTIFVERTKEPRMPTDEESFKKGYEDSQKAKFD